MKSKRKKKMRVALLSGVGEVVSCETAKRVRKQRWQQQKIYNSNANQNQTHPNPCKYEYQRHTNTHWVQQEFTFSLNMTGVRAWVTTTANKELLKWPFVCATNSCYKCMQTCVCALVRFCACVCVCVCVCGVRTEAWKSAKYPLRILRWDTNDACVARKSSKLPKKTYTHTHAYIYRCLEILQKISLHVTQNIFLSPLSHEPIESSACKAVCVNGDYKSLDDCKCICLLF